MTIEEQLVLKREVEQFYEDRITGTPSLNDLVNPQVNAELYTHLESKGLIPQGMTYQNFEQIVINKLNWAMMVSHIW